MRPTPGREHDPSWSAGARRWVWNWAPARRKAHHAEHGETIPAAQLSAELTALMQRPETAWLKEADPQALQQALKDLDQAFNAFFERRARFPRFKSKKRGAARSRIPQRVRAAGRKVYVPKAGWARIRRSREVAGPTEGATFRRAADGRWCVPPAAEFDVPNAAPPDPDPRRVVGVDLGLKEFAVLADGGRASAPKFHRRGRRKLRKAQRAPSRRQAGSKRRAKTKARLARVHQRIVDQRGGFLHKSATNLVRSYDGL